MPLNRLKSKSLIAESAHIILTIFEIIPRLPCGYGFFLYRDLALHALSSAAHRDDTLSHQLTDHPAEKQSCP
jgi:hypothetical protein